MEGIGGGRERKGEKEGEWKGRRGKEENKVEGKKDEGESSLVHRIYNTILARF